MADDVRASRAMVGRAQILLDRTYKRDKDGRFGSGGEAAPAGAVVATKTVSGDHRSNEGEGDLSVIRAPDGTARLHVGVGADGSTHGVAASLDQAGARQLQAGLTSTVASAKALQEEVKTLKGDHGRLEKQIGELDQKTMGAPTEHGREYVPLSPADEAQRAHLVSEQQKVERRVWRLEDDGEDTGQGVVHGDGGDVHYVATVGLPRRAYVDVRVAHSGGGDSDAVLSFTLGGAERFAGTIGEMADLM